jgi:hypothetical protein
MIRLRIFHPGRQVWRVRKRYEGEILMESWISFRSRPPDWEKIFASTLDLIWLPNTPQAARIQLSDRHGFIAWHESRWITKISIRIEGFSAPKKSLIATALLKAARFYLLEE